MSGSQYAHMDPASQVAHPKAQMTPRAPIVAPKTKALAPASQPPQAVVPTPQPAPIEEAPATMPTKGAASNG